MAEKERLQRLFDRFLQKECTPEEVEELVQLLREEEVEDVLTPDMQKLWEQVKSEKHTYPVDWQKMYEEITAHEAVVKRNASSKRMIWRIAAAVVVFIALSVSIYLSTHHAIAPEQPEEIAQLQHDVRPGGNKAVLTLANGATILLDQTSQGALAKQGNVQIVKLDSGALAYQLTDGEKENAKVAYNSLTTPSGGQYQLQLPDGTKVWLNAASSIRYPTAFTGHQREVKVTGEAYFEVAKNVAKPFVVTVDNMKVEVLGTHFNINAYADEEAIKTTLLEGKVKVKSDHNHSVVLNPGQQAQWTKEGQMNLMKHADVEEVSAWQRGLFVFHGDELPAIMRRLARWYDIQVEYKNNEVPTTHFTGAVQRNVNISEVLKMFELTGGVHFDIEGKKVIVSS